MKKTIIPLFLSIAAIAATSCNQELLDIEQKGVTAVENFYQTDEDAEAAMVAAYQGFLWNICTMHEGNTWTPFRIAFNACGDDFVAASGNCADHTFSIFMNEFCYDAAGQAITQEYQQIYYAMYYSNIVIDKFKDGLPGGNVTPTTKRVVAEARVLRAWMHMMLAMGWGTPPLVDHVLEGSACPYNCDIDPVNPKTHEELLEWCAEECLAALPDLDERKDKTDKDGAVKVTKGFANAVAGKAYVYAGKFDKAKAPLKAVIESGKYDLVPGERFDELFHIEGDCNEEKIFEANLETNPNVPVWWDILNRSTWMEANAWNYRSSAYVPNFCSVRTSVDGWGGCGVPVAFADEFVKNDGLNSDRLKASIISIEDILFDTVYNNPDLDNLTREQKEAATDKFFIKNENEGVYGQSLYLPVKPITRTTDLTTPGEACRVNNFTIMRLAEVYLLYAEACLQTNDAGTAKTYINKIQERAGSQTVSSTVDMNVLKLEKKLELWLEGCRWLDQVRWGDTGSLKEAGYHVPHLCDVTTRPKKPGDKIVKDGARFYVIETQDNPDKGITCGFVAGKHELFPFPQDVIIKNPNLRQNPNW